MLLPKQSRNCVTGLAVACSLLLVACAPKEVQQVNLIPKPVQ
jgi:hexosaminidase